LLTCVFHSVIGVKIQNAQAESSLPNYIENNTAEQVINEKHMNQWQCTFHNGNVLVLKQDELNAIKQQQDNRYKTAFSIKCLYN
jgi:hypothetical protein